MIQNAKQKQNLTMKLQLLKGRYANDVIYDIDHIRISGTDPLSVILSQTKKFKKLINYGLKVPKQAERDGVTNLTKLQFQSI